MVKRALKDKIKSKSNNYAFIDSQNVNLGIQELGWKLDFKKFRVYLKDKHKASKIYLFIGYMPEHQDLYTSLQNSGYVLVFKPTLKYKDGSVKGNCDAELVLQAMIEFDNYDKAVIITGDGDFHCLVQYLYAKNKLKCVLAPNQNKYSALLKKSGKEKLLFMNNLKRKLKYKK